MITFFVPGIPVPKGSRKSFICKQTGVIRNKDANDNTKPWQLAIAWATREAMSGRDPMQGAVKVTAVFHMPKPKSYPKRREIAHKKKPDLDKLQRALFDALKQGGAYNDDSQVIAVEAWKGYADTCGAVVTVAEVGE